MQISYKDKRNKTCKITIEGFNTSTVYVKKELFDMTEEELRANKERLIKELEEANI